MINPHAPKLPILPKGLQLRTSCRRQQLPSFLKDQLVRAASSIVLNLSEGSARTSKKDRARFYVIAFASLREVQALIDMEDNLKSLEVQADRLAAHLYKLTHG